MSAGPRPSMTAPGSQLEQRYRLAGPDPQGDRTFSYALTDRSLENISNLVRDPAIEDTHQIDRPAFRVESSAPSLRYVGIPAGLEYLSVLGFLGGLASIGLALLTRSPTLQRWVGVIDGLLARNQGLIRFGSDRPDSACASPEPHGSGVRLSGATPRLFSSPRVGRRHVLAPDQDVRGGRLLGRVLHGRRRGGAGLVHAFLCLGALVHRVVRSDR